MQSVERRLVSEYHNALSAEEADQLLVRAGRNPNIEITTVSRRMDPDDTIKRVCRAENPHELESKSQEDRLSELRKDLVSEYTTSIGVWEIYYATKPDVPSRASGFRWPVT